MTIERVLIKNYRTLRKTDLALNPSLNIVVGDNETGKSTLLEAINLALRCQINRRPAAQELHPFLINMDASQEFILAHKQGTPVAPPEVLIELYFKDAPDFALLKGINNSEHIDVPGISLRICLNPDFRDEYKDYISDPNRLSTIPTEFYHIEWLDFAGAPMSPRSLPFRPAMIDPTNISNTYAANRYVLEIIRDYLNDKQKVDLALSYRAMQEKFLSDKSVADINSELKKKTGKVSDKTLSVAMDSTARASWETSVLPHLDDIPLTLVGKGEQNSLKIKLAIEAEANCDFLLIEEPENHLSHTNLNRLINHIANNAGAKQIVVTTHNSFVLNKLGVDHVLMFNGSTGITLNDLPSDTRKYFMTLPGHETLRMILAERSILVEGPSDELIVQKAYKQIHGTLPLEDGVEVISVRALAFKRFLDIAKPLNLDVCVLTDNDGDVDALEKKYENYEGVGDISILYDEDEDYPTLEPQILKANDRELLNKILGKNFQDDDALLKYMTSNKTEAAMKILESDEEIEIPGYIKDAVE